MQDIAEHTNGTLKMGAGTLYGTIQRLLDSGMVREVESPPPETLRDERRRHYRLTPAGRRALDAEVHRLEGLIRVARHARAFQGQGMKTADLAARLYSRLLRLYPKTFYNRFGRDMSVDFPDGHTAARRDGLGSRLSFTARSYGDLVVSLWSQWLETERFVIWRMSVLVALAIWAVAVGVASLEWSSGPASPWFLVQLGVALTTGATLTMAIALHIHNREIPGRRALFADRAIESSAVLERPPVDPVIG